MARTPGVSVSEKDASAEAVVAVATAIPAFVGYTERADRQGPSVAGSPLRIGSLAEFHEAFGAGPEPLFTLTAATAPAPRTLSLLGQEYALEQTVGQFMLYYSLRLFFQSGGGACYVVSVGNYGEAIDPARLTQGIDLLAKEREPTLLVVPDAILLAPDDCAAVQRHMLDHCGNVMKNRFAILDLCDGFRSPADPAGDPVAAFRNALVSDFLSYGAAYYPWLNTTITPATALSHTHLTAAGRAVLQGLLNSELHPDDQPDEKKQTLRALIQGIANNESPDDTAARHNSLLALSPSYKELLRGMAAELNLLPPSGAMAGIYTSVDSARGVWHAPANVSLPVISPAFDISHEEQEDLNEGLHGPSINPSRRFVGEGTLVWGARTLDGNSLDWRYVNVRRTVIMLEESIRVATQAYVFAPNTSDTWAQVKAAIQDFLTALWKQGALSGAVADDAFRVFVGLGETMTAEDILNGILRLRILVAPTRPAEFVEIAFEQKMQGA